MGCAGGTWGLIPYTLDPIPYTRPGARYILHCHYLDHFLWRRRLDVSGCMRIKGEGLGSRGLASGLAVLEGRLHTISLQGLSLTSGTGLGELLAALSANFAGCAPGSGFRASDGARHS